jgi:hypothetical protein
MKFCVFVIQNIHTNRKRSCVSDDDIHKEIRNAAYTVSLSDVTRLLLIATTAACIGTLNGTDSTLHFL